MRGGCRVLWTARRMMAPGRARRDGLQCQGARHGRRDGREWRLILTVPGWCARRRRVVLLASSSLTASGWSLQGMVVAGTVVAGTVAVAAGDGRCGDGWLRQGRKKRPHMRPLYVKAICLERLYGELGCELRLSSSRRVPRSSSWGERIRGILQEPWCQQRCGRSYGIPKP